MAWCGISAGASQPGLARCHVPCYQPPKRGACPGERQQTATYSFPKHRQYNSGCPASLLLFAFTWFTAVWKRGDAARRRGSLASESFAPSTKYWNVTAEIKHFRAFLRIRTLIGMAAGGWEPSWPHQVTCSSVGVRLDAAEEEETPRWSWAEPLRWERGEELIRMGSHRPGLQLSMWPNTWLWLQPESIRGHRASA